MSDTDTIARLHATIVRLLEENERLRAALRQLHAVLRPQQARN